MTVYDNTTCGDFTTSGWKKMFVQLDDLVMYHKSRKEFYGDQIREAAYEALPGSVQVLLEDGVEEAFVEEVNNLTPKILEKLIETELQISKQKPNEGDSFFAKGPGRSGGTVARNAAYDWLAKDVMEQMADDIQSGLNSLLPPESPVKAYVNPLGVQAHGALTIEGGLEALFSICDSEGGKIDMRFYSGYQYITPWWGKHDGRTVHGGEITWDGANGDQDLLVNIEAEANPGADGTNSFSLFFGGRLSF
jgi:hypothetical protein